MRCLFVGWFSATADGHDNQHWYCRKLSFVSGFGKHKMLQKPRQRYWAGFWLLALCLFLFPINNGPLRISVVFLALVAYVRLIYIFRGRKPVTVGLISISVVAGIFFICPGSKPETQKLREAYIHSLRTYEGTRYLWGGENKLGIDCSGLVRASLIKANLRVGLATMNPELVRFSSWLWWHDCSAKALGEEIHGLTRRITQAPSVNSLDTAQIQPGDIAVTTSGVHVLAFLGNDEWIEADPDLRKVVIIKVPAKDNPWFDEPVRVLRWTELDTK